MRNALVFLLLIAMKVDAQAPKTFAEGVLAFEKKDWKNAERLMRETIAVNPTEVEGTVSIAGSWYETYVPHYFLARALARQGKCVEALKAFAESERQGVTPTIPDFAKHLETRGGCKPKANAAKPREIVLETTVPFGEGATTKPVTTSTPVPVVKPAPAPAPVRDPNIAKERAQLEAAVIAYANGRYDAVARLLTGAKFTNLNAVAESALLRAAARDALYRIGGEKDNGLRRQIEIDLHLYRQLRPNGVPDSRLFTPRFIASVSGTRRSPE
ncbi:MAG TPA: hypothetical protein VGQ76_19350 [Thermoanaerobaculia bacterium]|jgi:hypothetical protein|nr:hypothetical protein [Thermoanaerobaculia bacterium]